MYLREANLTDISTLAALGAEAFKFDPFFSFFCQHQEQYPDDVSEWLAAELREAIVAPGKVVIVACEPHICTSNADHASIVGWAYWERRGSDVRAGKWMRKSDQLTQSHVTSNDTVIKLDENHAFISANYDRYHDLAEEAFAFAPNRWHLLLVAVDQAHQRRGVGTELLNWGLSVATNEGVPIALESTEKGLRLYEKLGFKTLTLLKLRPGLSPPAMYWKSDECGPVDHSAVS